MQTLPHKISGVCARVSSVVISCSSWDGWRMPVWIDQPSRRPIAVTIATYINSPTVITPRTAIEISDPTAKLRPGSAALTAQANAASRTPPPSPPWAHQRPQGGKVADRVGRADQQDVRVGDVGDRAGDAVDAERD